MSKRTTGFAGGGQFRHALWLFHQVTLLHELGIGVRRMEGDRDDYAEILNPVEVSDETLFQVFSYPSQYGGLADAAE